MQALQALFNGENRKIDIKKFYNKYGIITVLIVILLVSSVISPTFLTEMNIINVLTQISVVTIIACGMTMLIISGMTDLSAGSVVALAGCLCVGIYKMLLAGGLPEIVCGILAVLSAMLIGVLLNVIDGIIITYYNAPPFIVTLAMMTAARGMVYIYTNGQPIYDIGNIVKIGQGKIGFLPYSVLIMILVLIVTWVMLNETRTGRYLYAIGGNQEAAVASGIKIDWVIIKAFMIHGAFVGLAGVLFMTRLNSGQPAEGVGLEFDAITAAIIGGTSMIGGLGTVTGTLCGAIIIGVINNVLNLMFVQSYYQQIIKGIIIVLAVILDIKTKGSKK
jgi:Ribose/xylose/arabinose/galactoside ABC-type transport systems, permease components